MTRADTLLTAALAAVGAFAVGGAIQVADGYGTPTAFVWLTVAVVAVLAAVVVPSGRPVEAVLRRALPVAMVVMLVVQLVSLVARPPAPPFATVPGWAPVFGLACVIVVTAAVLVAAARGVLRWAGTVTLIVVHLALGSWMLSLQPAPNPPIDVFVFQHDSVAALLRGVNPYSITFPNPYATGAYYGPGMVVDGQLQFGFVYPPLSVFLSTLGQWVGGDVRYAQLGAMTVAALCMATVRRGPLGPLAAALFLFTPRNLFVLEQSWTEPFVVLFLAVTVWCAARAPRLTPYALGLFLAVKQYAVLALPVALLLTRTLAGLRALVVLALPIASLLTRSLAGFRALFVRAVIVAAVVTLPLAVLDVPGFVRAVVTLQFAQPFRPEALSYLGLLSGPGGQPAFGTGVAFAVAAVVGGLALWRLPRTPAGYALGVAALFLAFFVLNKQAFANYYFFVIGTLCVAVAATDAVDGPWPTRRRAAARTEAEPADA